MIWRYWFGRVVNFGIIVIVQAEIATDTQIFPKSEEYEADYLFLSGPDGDNVAWNQYEPELRYTCRQDEVAMTLASVVITEFITKILTLICTGVAFKYILGAPAELDLSFELVWVLYY